MANANNPRGAVPIQRIDGAAWRDSQTVYFVPAANTNALNIGDFVTKVAGSADTGGINGVDLTAAGTNPITGVVVGFVGVCKSGAGMASASFWPLGTAGGQITRPATTAQDYYVLVNDDPETEFIIQENDDYGGVSGTPLPVAAVGKNFAFIHAAGNVYGLSGTMLDTNTVGTGATQQLNVKGFLNATDNTPAALYAKVIVTIVNHTETPHQAGI